MSSSSIVFNGHLTAEEPLTAVYPGVHPTTFADKTIKAPSFLPRMGPGIPLVIGDAKNAFWSRDDWKSFLSGRPYLQGSSFRGALRRCAFDVICDALSKAGKPVKFSQPDFYMLVEGFDIGTKKKDKKPGGGKKGNGEVVKPKNESDVRQANPLLALFGSWKLPAELGTGLIAGREDDRLETLMTWSVRTNDLQRSPQRIARLDEKAVADALDGVFRKEGDDNANLVQIQSIAGGYEAIAPHQALTCRMTLSARSDEARLGLLLCAIERFAQNPRIGGHFASGCGLVSGQWTVEQGGRSLGEVGFNGLSEGKFTCDDGLRKLMDQFIAGITQFDFKQYQYIDVGSQEKDANDAVDDSETETETEAEAEAQE